jgi:anti-sigma regulatory factor (Ser/Thr protein kinase)
MGAKERLDLRAPARPESIAGLRRQVMAFVSERNALDPHAVGLAVTEAATNVVLHAYRDGLRPGDMRVLLRRVDGCIDVNIRDDGVGMSPRGDSPGAGFGLGLMAHAADRCVITSAPGEGTDVLLRFELSR